MRSYFSKSLPKIGREQKLEIRNPDADATIAQDQERCNILLEQTCSVDLKPGSVGPEL